MVNEIQSQFFSLNGAKIHYLTSGNPENQSILFLHGASFSSRTWQEIGTIQFITPQGYHAIALDLPGYGKSAQVALPRHEFLFSFIESLKLNKPIIVSPSMSGSYSLPFIVNYPDKLRGFVAVAPVGIGKFSSQLRGIEVPTLAIWSSNDRIVPIQNCELLVSMLPNSKKVLLENAGHACYMRSTHQFNHHLLQFCQEIT